MRISFLTLSVAFAALSSSFRFDEVDGLAVKGLGKRTAYDLEVYLDNIRNGRPNKRSCDMSNVSVRREWYVSPLISRYWDFALTIHRGDLSKKERREYINAVLCLQRKEAITPRAEVPGVRTRYDDFVASHINQTFFTHATVRSHLRVPIETQTPANALTARVFFFFGIDTSHGLTNRLSAMNVVTREVNHIGIGEPGLRILTTPQSLTALTQVCQGMENMNTTMVPFRCQACGFHLAMVEAA